jgi:tRNA threonylcarbamoyl adenosine modification protein YeaZ
MTQNPLILAVETSGRIGSVAIAAGQQLLAETTFSTPMKHSAEIFPAACALLTRFGRKPKEIEHIYISAGPGSFTGLRIAVTLAKTMHLANATKVVAVDTLDVIAANVIDPAAETTNDESRASSIEHRVSSIEKIATILDAKRGQFFLAAYQCNTSHKPRTTSDEPRAMSHGVWKKVFPDALMTASQFLEKFANREKTIFLLGEGLVYYKDKFKADGVRFLDENYWTPQAAKVHLLGWEKAQAGQFANPLTLTPKYLHRPDVKEMAM